MCVLLGLSVTIRGDGLLPGGRGPTRGAAAGERTGAREHRHAAALRQGEAEGEVRLLHRRLPPPGATPRAFKEGAIMALGLGKCTAERLMPNIAIYCKTPMRSKGEELPAPWRPLALVAGKEVHVINVIGFAFDRALQPDYRYFLEDVEDAATAAGALVRGA